MKGKNLKVSPDHDSLKRILNLSVATDMLARWGIRSSEIDCDIVHRAGIKNKAADALSRLETQGENITDITDEIIVAIIDLNKDRNKTTKVLLCTVCHICDHKDHKTGRMMPEVQTSP